MKLLSITFLFVISFLTLKAQNKDYEIKVVSKKYQNVKGKLQKVNAEGIAIIDYKGNYLIFKANEIVRIKVKKRGLTIGEATGSGTIVGLAIGLGLLSLDKENEENNEMAKLAILLTASGAVIGVITGTVAEIVNIKLILTLNGDEVKFKKHYQKLQNYVNVIHTTQLN